MDLVIIRWLGIGAVEAWSGIVRISATSSINGTLMSRSKDKELAGGDVGAGSEGVAGGELVVDGKRTRDRGKGNVGVTRK